MGFSTDWLIEGRILEAHMFGYTDLKQVQQFSVVLRQYLGSATTTMHLLVDLSDITRPEMNLSAFKYFQYLTAHPHMGWCVTYGHHQNQLITYLAVYAARGLGINFRMTPTRHDALRQLLSVDSTLVRLFETRELNEP